jgi:hypothetical protein
MLKAKPLAAALAALSFAAAGQAGADVGQMQWIEVQSISMSTAAPAPAAPGGVAAPATAEPIGLLVPAVQKVREAAARTSSELTPEERAAFVGANQSVTVGTARSETVKAVPLTPLDDARPKQTLSAGTPTPSAAWYAKFDGVDGSNRREAPARAAPRGEQQKYMEFKLNEVLISNVQPGGSTPKPSVQAGPSAAGPLGPGAPAGRFPAAPSGATAPAIRR